VEADPGLGRRAPVRGTVRPTDCESPLRFRDGDSQFLKKTMSLKFITGGIHETHHSSRFDSLCVFRIGGVGAVPNGPAAHE
jgi:hypothetical protein